LEKSIAEGGYFGKPEALSLGTNGNYFARIGSQTFWNLAPKMTEHIGKIVDVKAIWFGMNDSYVCLRKNGSLCWNLAGLYPELADKLKDKTRGRVQVSPSSLSRSSFCGNMLSVLLKHQANNDIDYGLGFRKWGCLPGRMGKWWGLIQLLKAVGYIHFQGLVYQESRHEVVKSCVYRESIIESTIGINIDN
jgi:hypothetical protein